MNSDALLCLVCYAQYNLGKNIPRNMTCGHSICSCCLQKQLESKKLRRCPFDNQPFLPEQRLENFPVNFPLQAILEAEVKKQDRCKVHNNRKPTYFCNEHNSKVC